MRIKAGQADDDFFFYNGNLTITQHAYTATCNWASSCSAHVIEAAATSSARASKEAELEFG